MMSPVSPLQQWAEDKTRSISPLFNESEFFERNSYSNTTNDNYKTNNIINNNNNTNSSQSPFFILPKTTLHWIRPKSTVYFLAVINCMVFGILFFAQLPLWYKFILGCCLVLINSIHSRLKRVTIAFIPVVLWLTLFSNAYRLPREIRPPISTYILPTLDRYIFGFDFVIDYVAASPTPFWDIVHWIPYGVIHYILPFLFLAFLWRVIVPKVSVNVILVFAQAFGLMCLFGVMTQLIFPCSPPWYEVEYGKAAVPSYDIPGSPAGLARVDKLLQTNMYSSGFKSNPLVFGAFPSLHSGFASIIGMFFAHFRPKYTFLVLLYIVWIWWACMYFLHHYFIDLLAGFAYAGVFYGIYRKPLIRMQRKYSLDVSSLPTSGDNNLKGKSVAYVWHEERDLNSSNPTNQVVAINGIAEPYRPSVSPDEDTVVVMVDPLDKLGNGARLNDTNDNVSWLASRRTQSQGSVSSLMSYSSTLSSGSSSGSGSISS